MNLHCTKKLFEQLSISRFEAGETSASTQANPLLNWHANIVTIQRKQNLVFINDATRYAVFIPCVIKSDLNRLPILFQDVFINSLMKAGLSSELVEKAALYLHDSEVSLDTECSRSVQGTMRLMVSDVEITLDYRGQKISDLLPYSTSVMLSDRPCTIKGVKGAIWPIREKDNLLRGLPSIQAVE
ncbi:hypothetical protein BI198_10920 [Rheinheimera salexigens]|uniref:DUF6933 domain-containing protein n=1 Tax=Rheinheimera salexigens TaxID=1628148 RepID=A0A1E7Q7F3_9GAMM|nr:hypothetical protein BI198_10920 [Rheinheimera salexigens]